MILSNSAQSLVAPTSVLSHSDHQDERAGSNNSSTVLEPQALANRNPDTNPEVKRMLDNVSALPPRLEAIKRALREYLTSDQPLKEIAQQHSYTAAALLYWIRKLGLNHRPRGRQVMRRPNRNHRRIVELVRQYGVSETSRREGVSKQRISAIICRWAPELKGKRRVRNLVIAKPRKSRQLKRVIISFRISDEDCRLLLDSPTVGNGLKTSGSARARGIVLNHLRSRQNHATGAANNQSISPSGASYQELVNVYNFQVA